MKSNYDALGNYIRLVDTRNTDLVTEQVLGINIDKYFMPSVANVIGTDLSKYKLITKGKFACNPMHVGRDERLPVLSKQKQGILRTHLAQPDMVLRPEDRTRKSQAMGKRTHVLHPH